MERCGEILLLDDESHVLRSLARLLGLEFGDAVQTTEDPREALARLGTGGYKVLVTDYCMPGMNGVEVLREARRIAPDTVRILLTGRADKETVVAAINTGEVYRVGTKPWDNEAFVALIRDALAFHDAVQHRRERFASVEREQRDLRAAVDIARDIQRCVMPTGNVAVRNADVACFFTPWEHMTGDYADILPTPDGRTALVIGDVCGHGLGAALYVFSVRALIRSCLHHGDPVDRSLERANAYLCSDMDGRFMTLFVGLYDSDSRELTYVNAGHNAPLVVRGDAVEKAGLTGLPLGITEDHSYGAPRSLRLGAEDTLLLYTDGVIEARDEAADLFGGERLEEFLLKHHGTPPQALLEALWRDLRDFAVAGGVCDDLALIALRPGTPVRASRQDGHAAGAPV